MILHTPELFLSRGHVQNFEKAWKNSAPIRVDDFAKSVSF